MSEMVVSWEAEHDQKAPVVITSSAEMKNLGARLYRETHFGDAVLVNVVVRADPWKSQLLAGFNGDVGVVWYAGPDNTDDTAYSRSDQPSNTEPVTYYHITADFDFPINSEIPINLVQAALVEFFDSAGEKLPTSVSWQPRG